MRQNRKIIIWAAAALAVIAIFAIIGRNGSRQAPGKTQPEMYAERYRTKLEMIKIANERAGYSGAIVTKKTPEVTVQTPVN